MSRYIEKDGIFDNLYKIEEESSTFHLKQSYDEHFAKRLICKECNGDKFNVGAGDRYTAIKCVTCEWEQCIHEG